MRKMRITVTSQQAKRFREENYLGGVLSELLRMRREIDRKISRLRVKASQGGIHGQ